MKHFITLFLFCFALLGNAQKKNGPYLALNTTDAHVPLQASKTKVEISGTIAHVELVQTYQNKGTIPIEAEYVFPMSTQAAVHKMEMTIGDRTVHARIFEKQEAKKIYDQAVKEGKRAAKLDQDRPNVFTMKVGNIMPGDIVTIHIYYTELLVPLHGMYQFVAPGVVGPRFTGEQISGETAFHQGYTPQGIADTFDFGLSVQINAGMIIQQIKSSSHAININYPDAKTAEVFLSKGNRNPANRDFILTYSLRGETINTGLLLYEHEDENFFAYLMEPPKTVKLEEIPSREYLFIVDVSGSMNGYPLEVSKALMRNLLCNLRPTDTFNVQLFASSSTIFSPTPVKAHHDSIESAIRFLSTGQGGGGTQLLSALKTAYQLPRTTTSSARSMVVITDGYISVEKEAFQLIQEHLDQANVFTFGIGSSVNRYLIEGMAKVSHSESFVATTREEATDVAKAFKTYIETPLLTQVVLEAEGFEIYDVTPAKIPDVFAARPVIVYGKYKGKPQGTLRIRGYQGKQLFTKEYKVGQGQLSKKNKALRYLWARKKIETLDDYGKLFYEDVKEEVLSLGLQYHLMTRYTSFVAVDIEQVNPDGSLKKRKQPLPMPQHVSNAAVGAEAAIVAKTKYVPSFHMEVGGTFQKTEKRNLMIAFKANYASWIKPYLEHYPELRFTFDQEGKLVRVESKENGNWVSAQKILEAFSKSALKNMKTRKPMTITLKK